MQACVPWGLVIADSCLHAGTFENLLLGPGESYRPLMPKKLLAVYRKGACFGEPDLLHAQPHSSTVVCSGVGMLALVPRKQYLVPLLPTCSVLLSVQASRVKGRREHVRAIAKFDFAPLLCSTIAPWQPGDGIACRS